MQPENEKSLLSKRLGETGELTVGADTTPVKLVEMRPHEMDFTTFGLLSFHREARETFKERLRGKLEAEHVFFEIFAQSRTGGGKALVSQAQLATELNMRPGNVSRAVKVLLAAHDARSSDPLEHELVRRVGKIGFIVNPMFATACGHAQAWQIWFENAPDCSQRTEQEIKAAQRAERRSAGAEKRARWRRDAAEIKAGWRRRDAAATDIDSDSSE